MIVQGLMEELWKSIADLLSLDVVDMNRFESDEENLRDLQRLFQIGAAEASKDEAVVNLIAGAFQFRAH